MSDKIYELLLKMGAKVNFCERLVSLKENIDGVELVTNKEFYNAKSAVTCCGLQSDRVAGLNNKNLNIRIIPFPLSMIG